MFITYNFCRIAIYVRILRAGICEGGVCASAFVYTSPYFLTSDISSRFR